MVGGASSLLLLQRLRGSSGSLFPAPELRSGGDAECSQNLMGTNFCYLGVQLKKADLRSSQPWRPHVPAAGCRSSELMACTPLSPSVQWDLQVPQDAEC